MRFVLYPNKIIMNGINLYNVLDVTNFKVEATAKDLQKVWIEGFIKGSLIIDNEEIKNNKD